MAPAALHKIPNMRSLASRLSIRVCDYLLKKVYTEIQICCGPQKNLWRRFPWACLGTATQGSPRALRSRLRPLKICSPAANPNIPNPGLDSVCYHWRQVRTSRPGILRRAARPAWLPGSHTIACQEPARTGGTALLLTAATGKYNNHNPVQINRHQR